MPVHVEEARMRCVSSPFEGTLSPRILRSADAHVIGHDIDDQSHFMRAELLDEASQALLAAEL